jgi:hypothetical protein
MTTILILASAWMSCGLMTMAVLSKLFTRTRAMHEAQRRHHVNI